MTSAPNQASISVHDVPASNCVRSRTRIPSRALLMVLSPIREPSPPSNPLPQGKGTQAHIVTEMAHAPRIDFTAGAHYDGRQPWEGERLKAVATLGGMEMANQDAPAEIAVIFQVLYDTPQGTIRLTVQDYTQAAAEQGVRCQISHRK